MKKKETPLMRQYKQIKNKYPDTVLFFRLGDFFETFEDDAVITARVCGITLTKRNNGEAGDVPLAGFPHHQLDNYLPKLVRAGYRVAVCEQLEDPKQARGIVRRDVVEVVTPGTTLSDKLLSAKANNYCIALHAHKNDTIGVAFADISTGEFSCGDIPAAQLQDVLQLLLPTETLICREQKNTFIPLIQATASKPLLTTLENWIFTDSFAQELLLKQFKTANLKGFGVQHASAGLIAAGAVLHYIGETRQGQLPYITRLSLFNPSAYMLLDHATKRNLELLYAQGDDTRDLSLFSVIDYSLTPMGGRMLKRWLAQPLKFVEPIQQRLDTVQALLDNSVALNAFRAELKHIGDMERLMAKAGTGRMNPRDALALCSALERLPLISSTLNTISTPLAQSLVAEMTDVSALATSIRTALADEPPAAVGNGNVFRKGFSAELDEYLAAKYDGGAWVEQYQQQQREKTGIPSLKVSVNNVFGYYIEISNAHRGKAPESYSRKQTLANAERYTTPELKAIEDKVLRAEEKIGELERALFAGLVEEIARHAEAVLSLARIIATVDCLAGYAVLAMENNYCKPEINDSEHLSITLGRHPVVEKRLPVGEAFIPNDTLLDTSTEQIHILTGPNMAGKSCYLRQTALIVLLAQAGCFVPAKQARIGIVDRIFTRVGAQDNINAGESTFLVEMQEAANIVNNATAKSLILLDEVGRGTATFDGIAIAWSLVEYLHSSIGARTLFATHYHELTELAERFPRIVNYKVEVKEVQNTILFTRKVVRGSADHSFGIHVARMAGLPPEITSRADDIMKMLEENAAIEFRGEGVERQTLPPKGKTAPTGKIPSPAAYATDQLTLFEFRDDVLRDKLRNIDVNSLTPLQALQLIAELHAQAKE